MKLLDLSAEIRLFCKYYLFMDAFGMSTWNRGSGFGVRQKQKYSLLNLWVYLPYVGAIIHLAIIGTHKRKENSKSCSFIILWHQASSYVSQIQSPIILVTWLPFKPLSNKININSSLCLMNLCLVEFLFFVVIMLLGNKSCTI